MTKDEILELAKSCGFDDFVGEKDDETDGVYWQFWEDQLIEFAQKIYEMGYNTANAQIEIQQMLIDALEKNNKELTDAQMEHEVKVGKLEDEVEKLKDEVDYWRGE